MYHRLRLLIHDRLRRFLFSDVQEDCGFGVFHVCAPPLALEVGQVERQAVPMLEQQAMPMREQQSVPMLEQQAVPMPRAFLNLVSQVSSSRLEMVSEVASGTAEISANQAGMNPTLAHHSPPSD